MYSKTTCTQLPHSHPPPSLQRTVDPAADHGNARHKRTAILSHTHLPTQRVIKCTCQLLVCGILVVAIFLLHHEHANTAHILASDKNFATTTVGGGINPKASTSPKPKPKASSTNQSSTDTITSPASDSAYVALCAIMRNEHCNVMEWVEYHKWLGIGKFYIFDHGSKPPMSAILEPYLADGTVEYHHFTTSWMDDRDNPIYANSTARTMLTPQAWAYDSCFLWYGQRHKYIALLDADEFLVIKPPARPDGSLPKPDVREYLQKFEHTGGVSLHWHLFGAGGHDLRPTGCTLSSYTGCMAPEGIQGHVSFKANPLGYMKSIARTEYWKGGCNPHMCGSQRVFVMSDGTPLSIERAATVQYHTAYINHYITRSKQEYHLKMKRGTGNTQYLKGSKVRSKDWKYFNYVQGVATSTCIEGQQLSADCCPQYCNVTAPQECVLPVYSPKPSSES